MIDMIQNFHHKQEDYSSFDTDEGRSKEVYGISN